MDSLLSPEERLGNLGARDQVSLSWIDASMRSVCLFFFIAALSWLLIGTAFALIASFSLHSPDLFPNWEWLTFGRIRSAHLNSVALS